MTPSGRPERSRSSIPAVSCGPSVLKCRHDPAMLSPIARTLVRMPL